MKKLKRTSNLKEIIINFTKNNSKEYILVILIFIIGTFIGIMHINNCSEEDGELISNYISDFIQNLKNTEEINYSSFFMNSIKNNILLGIIIWLAGTTIIGLPIVLGLILFRGYCIGFTISGFCFSLGLGKGFLFSILCLFLQNVFFIPALLSIGVSSIRLYKSIINDRRKENIKIEIIRHTVISSIMLFMLIFSGFVENQISVRVLKFGIKFIN